MHADHFVRRKGRGATPSRSSSFATGHDPTTCGTGTRACPRAAPCASSPPPHGARRRRSEGKTSRCGARRTKSTRSVAGRVLSAWMIARQFALAAASSKTFSVSRRGAARWPASGCQIRNPAADRWRETHPPRERGLVLLRREFQESHNWFHSGQSAGRSSSAGLDASRFRRCDGQALSADRRTAAAFRAAKAVYLLQQRHVQRETSDFPCDGGSPWPQCRHC